MAEKKATATKKEAVRQVSLDDIKFNKENATMAAVSCIPIVGAVMFFVEKKDMFVKYYAAQFALLGAVGLVLGIITPLLLAIPVLGLIIGLVSVCIAPVISIGSLVLMIMGAMKAYKGERFDVPVLSGWALKLMSSM